MLKNKLKINIQASKEEVGKEFAAYIEELVRSEKEIYIALSGGSTPKLVFNALVAKSKEAIEWEKVHFYWGDERCVPPTDAESNYGMAKEYLLAHIDIPDANVHRILGENNPEKEARRYGALLETSLPNHNGKPQFDLVILGMGDDGHTASIFPNDIALYDSKNNCEVATHPETGQKRITITGRVINNSKEVVFLVTGNNKADKVAEIINMEEDYTNYPAALVKPLSSKLKWYLDTDAASELIS